MSFVKILRRDIYVFLSLGQEKVWSKGVEVFVQVSSANPDVFKGLAHGIVINFNFNFNFIHSFTHTIYSFTIASTSI